VDIRSVGPLHSALAKVNARHPRNHNEYFHGWILRNLPERRSVAVDIGCGAGVLAGKLATYFTHVTGINADEGMVAAASARLSAVPQATIRRCGFAEFISAVADGGADLITMVAVLHWLDVDDALARIPALLAPGGRLLVVGLARADSPADLAFDVASGVANRRPLFINVYSLGRPRSSLRPMKVAELSAESTRLIIVAMRLNLQISSISGDEASTGREREATVRSVKIFFIPNGRRADLAPGRAARAGVSAGVAESE
jgi:SAM-dependent methyltransferase